MRCIVVGGGAIGGAVSLALAKAGVETINIRKSRAGEASIAAAGILGAQIESHGDGPLARLCLASREGFERWAREIERDSGVDVEFRASGVFKPARSQPEFEAIVHSMSWQNKAGLRFEIAHKSTVREIAPELSVNVIGGVFFPDDARVDPSSLTRALNIAGERAGVRGMEGEARRIDQARVTLADGEVVEGDRVVVAAGSWSSRIEGVAMPPDAVEPVRGQILELVAARPLSTVIDAGDVYL